MSNQVPSRKSASRMKKSLKPYARSNQSPHKRQYKHAQKKKLTRRDSLLRPSVYQKLQKKRKSLLRASKSLHIANAPHRHQSQKNAHKALALAYSPSPLRSSLSYRADHGNVAAAENGRGRTVFLCVRGLFACWRAVSPQTLFDALLILPLRAEWLRSPNAHNHCFADILSDDAFVTLLRWKDTQGLLFLMLPDAAETSNSNSLQHRLSNQHSVDSHIIDPFWLRLSARLERLWDPATQRAYRPLRVDTKWWQRALSSPYHSRFGVSARDVLDELRFLTLKFAAIREILYQANPSLESVIELSDVNAADRENPKINIKPRRSILETAHLTAALSIGSIDSESDADAPRRDRPRLSMIEFGGLSRLGGGDGLDGSDSNLEELALNARVHDSEDSDDDEHDEKQIAMSGDSGDSESGSLSTSESTNVAKSAMAKNVSTDSTQSSSVQTVSQIDCNMDWWLCPEYYFDTPAAKFDSDEDTE